MNNFVIKGDICYSLDRQLVRTIEGGYLVSTGGKSMGAFDELPEQYRALPLIDRSGMLVIPGLVDLHMHAPQHTFRGLGMDLELLDWLDTHTFPEESSYNELEYARRAYELAVADIVSSPNTRVCMFATAHVPATELLMDMMERTGLVSMVGKVNMDRNSPDGLREESASRSLSDTVKWLDASRGKYSRTQPILTPRFIPSCSDELMRGLAKLQQERQLPLQSHLSENKGEIDWVRELCPASDSYARAYYDLGLMRGDPTIMAHCVWNDDAEIELMKASGTYVAHCPQSNMNLSSGVAPVSKYLDSGLNVGLGSDIAGGCHVSMLRAMSDAIQASKLRWRLLDKDVAPITYEEAFYMGTLGGGSFFGKVGSFDVGYEFDAVVIDDSTLKSARGLSVLGRLQRAIYLSDDRHVVEKYVRGEHIFGQVDSRGKNQRR